MIALFFTKNRPLQFRGLLESFFYNTNLQVPVKVLAGSSEGYEDIREEFSKQIEWIDEQKLGFGETLFELIGDFYDDLVLFGVDDQIITGPVDLQEADRVMNTDPTVFNYSFRAGTNIQYWNEVKNSTAPVGAKSLKYLWRGKPWNWGYPLSLDFLVYRCSDLIQVMNASYKVPADFEAASYQFFQNNYIARDYMALADGKAVAYCQDLNKVQLNHGAPCYGDETHAPDLLLYNYVKKGARLDWEYGQGYDGDNPFCRDAIWKLK